MSLSLGVLVLGRYPPETMRRLAEIADRELDVLWYADERFFRDCYVALTYCGAITRRVQLGTCVADPYSRHPAIAAAAIASLDELSGGRAIFGIGAGISGFSQLGITQDRPAVAIREAIQLMRALFAGERVTFDGKIISFRDGELEFRARPDLPIYVATQSPITLRVAGELADGVIVEAYTSEAAFGFVQQHLSEGAARGVRQGLPLLVARLDTCIVDDPREAYAAIKPRIARTLMMEWPRFASMQARGLTVPPSLEERVAGIGYTRDPKILGPAADQVPDEWVQHFALAGTPDQIRSQIQHLRQLGAEQIVCYPLPVGDQTADGVLAEFVQLARSVE